MSRRKRLGKRERARMNYMMKCHRHERKVAERIRRERTAEHRGGLLRNFEDIKRKARIENKAPHPRLGFLKRLLGR